MVFPRLAPQNSLHLVEVEATMVGNQDIAGHHVKIYAKTRVPVNGSLC